MDVDRDTMIRLLRGELSAAEADRVRSVVGASPQLTAQLDRLQRLEDVLSFSRAESFGPYFSDRVMNKLTSAAGQHASSMYDALQWVFMRLAVATLFVVIGLGVYNAVEAQSSGIASSTVEAVFGLPSTDIDNLYYLQGI